MSEKQICEKCGSTKEPILCTSDLSGYADVDIEDKDFDALSEIIVDTCFQVWMHICRDCHALLDSGVENWGEIKQGV